MGFVPDELVEGTEVMVVAQAPGEYEERGERVVGFEWAGRRRVPLTEPAGPAPLIGPTGWEMAQTYFPLAQLERGRNVSLANVLKCRHIKGGTRTNDLPTGTTRSMAVEHCTTHHFHRPSSVEVVVAMGALAAQWLGCPGKVSEWRGCVWER